MSGVRFEVDFEVTDPNIPVLYPDPLMSKGSLMLMDLSNTYVAQPASIVAGALIQNVAWETAKYAMGHAGSQNDYAAIVDITVGYSGSVGKAEITPKKGIHALISQVNHTTPSTQRFNIYLPAPIREYLVANQNHEFYVSQWKTNTREAAAGIDFADVVLAFSTTAVYLTFANPISASLANGQTSKRRNGLARTLGNSFKNIAFNRSNSSTAVSNITSSGNCIMASGGGLQAYQASNYANKVGSYVTYRVYIEDLTVSGRTYEQVDALDYAMYQQAFAEGGKFHGDTFTDPATLP